jgi:ribosomal protein S18 acetylase RimI-like enzyme
MVIAIEIVSEATPELLTALRSLVRQLNFHLADSEQPEFDESQIARVVAAPGSVLLIARAASGQIVGTATVAIFDTPTGRRAWIEDVVVDASVRGQGVGEALTREAVRRADEAGADHVDLTSASYREAANRLYPRIGFEQRSTNVYRLRLRPH